MKRVIALCLSFSLCFFLFACGKSDAVIAAEEAIAAIGTVTIDSGDAIANAEKLYNILSDSEKQEVENRLILVEAQEAFEQAQIEFELMQAEQEQAKNEAIYNNAKHAFELLKEASAICSYGMDAVYGAWYFGIYEAHDTYNSFFYNLSMNTPGLPSNSIESAANKLGISEREAREDWNNCLNITLEAISQRGDYMMLASYMAEAETTLQTLVDEYSDYTYYPKLKEYFSAVSSYAQFFISPSGSFKQLADTINNYENTIRTLESDVSFLFS